MENMDNELTLPKCVLISPAENTLNPSKHFSPKCLPKPKSLRFLKKSSLWVSVVRGYRNHTKQNDAEYLCYAPIQFHLDSA